MVRVDEIPREENALRWLVEPLWGESSVGVIGGAPKCAKTWLGLTRIKLRDALSVKNERLGEALRGLEQAGRISCTSAGWQRKD